MAENIPFVESDNIIPNQESENIKFDTNRQHHAPGKKTLHYLLEFLLLFLAVFCGFIAENWREQGAENKLEKEFIYSMVEDIKSDILQSNELLIELKSGKVVTDSVMIELSSPGIIWDSNNAYRLWSKNIGFPDFISNDRTIQQLKNTGGLTLIRNKAVSDAIIKYDQTVKNYGVQADAMLIIVSDQHIFNQLFDFINLDNNVNTPVPLTDHGKKLLSEAYADRKMWKLGVSALINRLEEINEEGKRVVIFIQKEYHLE